MFENVDAGEGNDDVELKEETPTAVSIALFVNASTCFHNAFRLNLMCYTYWIQGI
jgi:hypothetical protein